MKQRILLGGNWLDIENRQETDEYGWFRCDLIDGVDKMRPMDVCQDMIAALIDLDQQADGESADSGTPKVKIAKPTVLTN